ncbi:YcxB family protein [Kineococcus sp. GCM10028916]|uniref:YcxB family protein n=1 Tax=Kineococcus sp. GCM10028916 TaxID=3273394 RepID=UPI00363A9136
MSSSPALPVLLDWVPERYELDEAFRAAFAASAGRRFLVSLIGLVLVLVGGALLRTPFLALVGFGGAAGLLAWRSFGWRLAARRAWRLPIARARRELVVAEDGVHVRTASGSTSHTVWADVRGIAERPHVLVLELGTRLFLAVPRRAFPSPEVVEFVRRTVAERASGPTR